MQELNLLEWSYEAALTVCTFGLKVVLTGFFIALHIWAIAAASLFLFYGSVILFHSVSSAASRARSEAETIRAMDPRYRRY